MSTIRSLRQFARLSWTERAALAQAAAMLPATAIAVRTIGLRRWQSCLTGRWSRAHGEVASIGSAESISAGDDRLRRARKISCLVAAAANRCPYRSNCLQQSLTTWWLLRRNGIESDLRIGTRKTAGSLEAHAWVEVDGQVVNDHNAIRDRFVSFERSVVPLEVRS